MSTKNDFTIGIDLGISSISIAIINKHTKKIVDAVVIAIPQKGGKEKKTKEGTKAFRRQERQIRTQIDRKGSRIKDLIKLIAPKGLLPLANATEFLQNRKKDFPRTKDSEVSPKRKSLQQFFSKDALQLQTKALRGETLDEITDMGRILYAFAQRRGFPEAIRRNTSDAKGLTEGDVIKGKIGTNETEKSIQALKKDRYLPVYLASLRPKKETPWIVEKKIRNHHTYRYMYVEAFLEIWDQQKKKENLKEILTDSLKEKVFHTLFYQRPIQTPKRAKCTFEKDKLRAYKCSLLFEEFRILKFINNLRFEEKSLSQEEKNNLSQFLIKKKFKIPQIKKRLSKESIECNYDFEGGSDIVGMPVTSELRNIFGKKTWESLSQAEKEKRWKIIFQDKNMLHQSKAKAALTEYQKGKKEPWIDTYAKEKWNFTEKQLEKFNELNLPPGTTHLSEKAIKYILPYIKKGFSEADACILGSIKKAFGHNFSSSSRPEDKPNYWDTLSLEEKEQIEKDVIKIIRKESIPNQYDYQISKRPIDNIIAYLTQKYPQKAYAPEKIYHHSDHRPTDIQDLLPAPPKINQPIVSNILHQLHRTLNALLKKHGIQQPTIWVEMARDLKSSPEKAKKTQLTQNKNRAINLRIYEELLKKGIDPTPTNIMKYRLWVECKHQCVYTGDSISFNTLFEENEFQLEHIVPRKPNDTRMINMTLCRTKKNQKKNNNTPFQAFSQNEKEWGEMKQRAFELLPYRKYQRFILEKLPDEPLLQADIDVTGYIAKATGKYLQHITPHIYFTQGRITSLMSKQWGLDRYLSPTLRMPPPKQKKAAVGLCLQENAPKQSPTPCYPLGRYYIAVEKGDRDHVIPYKVIAYARFCPNTMTKKEQTLSSIEEKLKEQLTKLAKVEAKKKSKEKDANTKKIEAEIKAIKEVIQGISKEEYDLQKSIQKQEKDVIESLEKIVKENRKARDINYKILSGTIKHQQVQNDDKVSIFIPENRKNREDHRHHLVDALIIASLNLEDVNTINQRSSRGKDIEKTIFPPPWETFANDVKICLQKTLVQNRKKDKLLTKKRSFDPKNQKYVYGLTAQGQLHKASYYGKHISPINGEIYYHHRIPIEELRSQQSNTYKSVIKRAHKIADPVIRNKVLGKLRKDQKEYQDTQRENNPNIKESNLNDKIQGNPFFTEITDKDGNIIDRTPNIFLTSKKHPSAKIPVLRVRLHEKRETLRMLSTKKGTNRYVDTKKNYCIGFYEMTNKKGNTEWIGRTIPFWDASEKKRQGKPILPQNQDGNLLVFSLKQNDLLLINLSPEERDYVAQLDPKTISEHLYRLNDIAQSGKMHLIKHTSATKDPLETISCQPDTLRIKHPVKVILDHTGNIKHYIAP